MAFELIQTVMLPVDQLRENRGQIGGVWSNPRSISPSKLRKLCQSIRDYPEMLAMRELLVYPHNGKYIIIGGNMRYKAMKMLGYSQAPCKVIPETATPEQIKSYMLRDNSHFGEWEFGDVIDFNRVELELAQVPVPNVDFNQIAAEAKRRAAWYSSKASKSEPAEDAGGVPDAGDEPCCDMVARPAMYFRDEMAFAATFKRSADGIPLSQIKVAANVDLFAESAELLLRKILRVRDGRGWSIITTPSRRHKEGNFAEAVVATLSKRLGVPYHAGFAMARNRSRVEPQFTPQYEITESNIILYDDIFTTGTTIRAMLDLLPRKNVVVIVGVNNN